MGNIESIKDSEVSQSIMIFRINYMALIAFAAFLVIILSSCSLDRSNPLDPKGNSRIKVPSEVVGLGLELIREQGVPQAIRLNWEKADSPTGDEAIMGYYIYRSFSRHSRFERVHTETNINITSWIDRNNISSGNEYWYRVSTYIEYPEGRLEGRLSPLTERSAIWVN